VVIGIVIICALSVYITLWLIAPLPVVAVEDGRWRRDGNAPCAYRHISIMPSERAGNHRPVPMA
jgi:hypothetical protein